MVQTRSGYVLRKFPWGRLLNYVSSFSSLHHETFGVIVTRYVGLEYLAAVALSLIFLPQQPCTGGDKIRYTTISKSHHTLYKDTYTPALSPLPPLQQRQPSTPSSSPRRHDTSARVSTFGPQSALDPSLHMAR
jgi:hypothetical protein